MHHEHELYGTDFRYALCIYHHIYDECDIAADFAAKAENEKEWKNHIINMWKEQYDQLYCQYLLRSFY